MIPEPLTIRIPKNTEKKYFTGSDIVLSFGCVFFFMYGSYS